MGGYENFASMLIEFKEMKRSIQEKDEKIESLKRELASVRMVLLSQIE
jgi:archaellum component FlaC